jgi:valyl-tRNA synthetase
VSPRNDRARQAVERLRHEIGSLANVTIERVGEPDARDGFVVATSPAAETFLPLGSYLDLDAERSRIEKRLDALRKDAAGHEAKLANEGFTSKAPTEIVEKEWRRLADIQEEIAALGAQLEELR